MKKILCIILFASILPFSPFAQENIFTNLPSEPAMRHNKRDFSIYLSTAYLSANNPYNSTMSGGIKIRMFLGERISFDSGFLIGQNHSQWGVGVIGIPLWVLGIGIIADGEDDFGTEFWKFLFFGTTMLLSSEHIAYHIPMHNKVEFSPYVSFLRLKQFTVVNDQQNFNEYYGATCFALGMELNTYFNKFIVSPYVDYNIAYSGDFRGFNIGLNVGYYLPTKRK